MMAKQARDEDFITQADLVLPKKGFSRDNVFRNYKVILVRGNPHEQHSDIYGAVTGVKVPVGNPSCTPLGATGIVIKTNIDFIKPEPTNSVDYVPRGDESDERCALALAFTEKKR